MKQKNRRSANCTKVNEWQGEIWVEILKKKKKKKVPRINFVLQIS